MKRRLVDPDGLEVPEWVLESASLVAAKRAFVVMSRDGLPRPTTEEAERAGSFGHAQLFALHRFRRSAGQGWCAERGLSYCMTVLGSARPSSSEVAAGCIRGAGPKHHAKQSLLRATR